MIDICITNKSGNTTYKNLRDRDSASPSLDADSPETYIYIFVALAWVAFHSLSFAQTNLWNGNAEVLVLDTTVSL